MKNAICVTIRENTAALHVRATIFYVQILPLSKYFNLLILKRYRKVSHFWCEIKNQSAEITETFF